MLCQEELVEEQFHRQMTEMLNELDPDIEITSENIVNPGKKKKEPLGEVDFFSSFPKKMFFSF